MMDIVTVRPGAGLVVYGQTSSYAYGDFAAPFDEWWTEGAETFAILGGRLVRLPDGPPRALAGGAVRYEPVGLWGRLKRRFL